MSTQTDQNELFLKQKASAAVTPIPTLPKLADHFIPVKPEHKVAVQNWDNAMEEWRKKLNQRLVDQNVGSVVQAAAAATTVKTTAPVLVSSGPVASGPATPDLDTDEILAALNF